MMAPRELERQYNLRLSDLEFEELKRCAERVGMTTTDFIRHAIGVQLERDRNGTITTPHVEGKWREAELARYTAELSARKAGVPVPMPPRAVVMGPPKTKSKK